MTNNSGKSPLLKNLIKARLSDKMLIILCIALAAIKLILTSQQVMYLTPEMAPIDDSLMYNAAVSITQGNWLGEYGWLTISKHMFFSVWLSLLHALHIPYLIGGQLLWLLASAFAVLSFKPIIKNNYARLAFFAVMAFNPVSWAEFTLRVYRDNIFPALCVFVFSGFIAFALRIKQPIKYSLFYLGVAGLGFGCAYLTREDGIWLAPFILGAVLITISFIVTNKQITKKLLRCCAFLLPAAVSALCILSFCTMNYIHYGRFIVSDFTSSEFKQAFGTMLSIKQENEQSRVPLNKQARMQMYENSPSLNKLKDILETEWYYNRYGNLEEQNFYAGGFYWALREAAGEIGVYENAQTAQQYFKDVTTELNSAIQSGSLKSNGAKKSVTMPFRASYIMPVIGEGIYSLGFSAVFAGCNPDAKLSIGTPEMIGDIEAYLGGKANLAAQPYTDLAYYSPMQRLAYFGLNCIAWVYRILLPLALVAALYWQIKSAVLYFKSKNSDKKSHMHIEWFIMLGILASFILRAFMIAYVEVTSFGIGTYVMYLSTVHPLMLVYAFVGVSALINEKRGVLWQI